MGLPIMNPTTFSLWQPIAYRGDRRLAGTGYVEAKRELLDKIPFVKAEREHRQRYEALMQERYDKREASGNFFDLALNRYNDLATNMGRAVNTPFWVIAEILKSGGIHPEPVFDLATVALTGRTLAKGMIRTTVTPGPARPPAIKGRSPYANKNVIDVKAYAAQPVKADIPKYSSGPIVQTKEGTFYRPTKRLASQFAYKTEKLATGGRLSRSGKPGLLPGTQDIASQGISKADTALFNKVYGYIQKVRRQAPHHILDHSLTGQAYNRKDAPEVIDILATKHGIVGGNVRSNLMAATHDYTMKHLLNVRSEINRLRVEGGLKPLDRLDRQLIEATKAPERANEKLWLSPRQMKTLDLAGPGVVKEALSTLKPNLKPGYSTRITSLLPKGVSIKDMRLDTKNMILGKDHMHVIHAAYERTPERKTLMKLIQSDKWLTLTPEEAADEIAKVYRIMENITINASAWRLKLIKAHLRRQGALGRMIADDSAKLKAWLIENPQIAANLNLTKKAPSWQELAYKPSDLSDEIRTVFEFSPDKPGVTRSTLSDFQAQWNAIYAPNKPWLTR